MQTQRKGKLCRIKTKKTTRRTRNGSILKSPKLTAAPGMPNIFYPELFRKAKKELSAEQPRRKRNNRQIQTPDNNGTCQGNYNVEIFEVDASTETNKISTSQALDLGIDGDILKDVGSDKVGAPTKTNPQPRSEHIDDSLCEVESVYQATV